MECNMELPKNCRECSFFETREDASAWPYVCILEETETIVNEEGVPDDCPLHDILKDRGSDT